jgi:hypothetical protein
MGFRFEFDRTLHILLGRLDGRLTNEVLSDYYEAARKRAKATNAKGGITDFTGVTEFAVTGEFVRQLAKREPILPDTKRPRVVVAPKAVAFGIARMFQITGERTRPRLMVVHTLDEALTALGIASLRLEPLE